jgi:hypothetical protein
MRTYDATELIPQFQEEIAELEAERAALKQKEADDDNEEQEQRPAEEIEAEIRANRAMIAFFEEHKEFTHADIIALRDTAFQRGMEKRQPGGPYEQIPEYKMYKTEEGRILISCEALFQMMHVINFTS